MKSLESVFKTHISNTDKQGRGSYISRDNLFVIVDGVGGEYLGEIAREQAHNIIPEAFFRHLSEHKSPGDALIYALEEANQGILEERTKLGEKMAASVSAVFITDNIMYFTHLGDSRIYSFQEGELNQLTRDHTLKEEDPFAINRTNDPRALYALTRGLGIHMRPDIKVKKYPLYKRGLIIMTTASLTERITDRDILSLARKYKKTDILSESLIDLSKRKGGDGNITFGILKFGGLSKWLRNVIMTYAVFFLIILVVVAGYTLKYGGDDSDRDEGFVYKTEPQVITPEPETAVKERIVVPIKPAEEVADEQSPDIAKSPPVEKEPVEKEVEEDTSELYDQIYILIRDWKSAWEKTAGENGDLREYISFYSDNFQSKGLDKGEWERDKARKNRKKSWISISMSDIKITGPTKDNRVEVRFNQDYKSSNFSVRSGKTLILEGVGTEWKIVDERSY